MHVFWTLPKHTALQITVCVQSKPLNKPKRYITEQYVSKTRTSSNLTTEIPDAGCVPDSLVHFDCNPWQTNMESLVLDDVQLLYFVVENK